MKLRAHNLLCIQGYVGKGYSPEFTANMDAVVASLDDDALVTVVEAPDVLCDACPNLTRAGCALHGLGTEAGIVYQDRDVMHRLGLAAGETVRWAEVRTRIARAITPDDLDTICGRCPWLALGHCKAGVSALRP